MSGMGGSPLDGEIREVLEFEGRVMDQCDQRLPDSKRSFAAPRRVWAALSMASCRGRPQATPPSARASAKR